ncbi:MAG: hypothetical protein RR559_01955 [Bacteroides sp.]
MQKFKLAQRGNPSKKDAPKKWYGIPISSKPMELKAMTRAATENTTTAPIEMEGSMELFSKFAMQQLMQGHTVNVPGFGSFRISFKSEGVEDITKFNASTMIKNPRIIFTPSKELRDAVKNEIKFENGGVIDGKISYASMADYRLAKGIKPGGGGGGSDGDENDNPLG